MKDTLRPLALATQLGVAMGLMTVCSVLLGLFMGSWVDGQLGTRPVATLLFILLGILAGSLGTINLARSTLRQLNAAAASRGVPRTAFSAADLGRALVLVAELIVMTLVPVGLALALGILLDRSLGTRPVVTIILATLSVILALFGVYVLATRAARRAGHDS